MAPPTPVTIAVDAGTTGVARSSSTRRCRRRPGLPRTDPVLPPARLGRARPRRTVGGRALHPRARWPVAWPTTTGCRVALGITNQRETVIAWDRRSGEPLHRALVWQDRRTAAACDRLVAGRPPPRGPGPDRPGPRPVLLGHQDALAAHRGRCRPRPRRTWRSGPWTRGSCGTSPAARGRGPAAPSSPPTPPTPRVPSCTTSSSDGGPRSSGSSSASRPGPCPRCGPSCGRFGRVHASVLGGGLPACRRPRQRHRR